MMPDVNLQSPLEAYDGDDPFVFVSYAHKDAHMVYPEIKALHDSGVRIWFDGGIDPGNEWPEDIARALLKAHIFLVFITPLSVESQNVRNEINFAINKKKLFLAVHLNETQLPGGLELRMGDIQAILKHRMTEENYKKKLLNSFPKEVIQKNKKNEIKTLIIRNNPNPANANDEVVLKKSSCNEISEITKTENRENTENFLFQAIKETYKQISNAGISNIFLSPDIPQKKSNNVTEKYSKLLNPKEQILLVYDGTMFGSAKDGFILTSHGIGWSETWGTPKYCKYEEIELENVQKTSGNDLIFVKSLQGAYIYSGQINIILPNIIEFIKKVQEIKCI